MTLSPSPGRGRASPIVDDEALPRMMSVAQASYKGQQNATPTIPSISRNREVERSKEHRARAPKFTAKSNYECSFTNAVSPPPVRGVKYNRREAPRPKFEANSTSRLDFHVPSTTDYPQRVSPPKSRATSNMKFTATSETRRNYVNHHQKSVPPRRKDHGSPFPHLKFTAISESQAAFGVPPPPRTFEDEELED